MANILSQEEYRRGRRIYGHIATLDDGSIVYIARRKHKHIFRSGHSSISGAMSEGEAAWAIDEVTLYGMRARGIKIIGVHVEDTGDMYWATMADFFDMKKYKVHDYTGIGRGGSRQRVLPFQHFTVTKGIVELPIDRILR